MKTTNLPLYPFLLLIIFSCRLLLCEVGYQAGQHELISEALTKQLPAEIKTKAKEVPSVFLRSIPSVNVR